LACVAAWCGPTVKREGRCAVKEKKHEPYGPISLADHARLAVALDRALAAIKEAESILRGNPAAPPAYIVGAMAITGALIRLQNRLSWPRLYPAAQPILFDIYSGQPASNLAASGTQKGNENA
jgi:hypothetical protein